jgi:hypothetical protein
MEKYISTYTKQYDDICGGRYCTSVTGIEKLCYSYKLPEVGTRNFFSSPQSQFHNLQEALPQSQFRNFLRNVAPQPQLHNSAIAMFSEVRNLRVSLPQFSAIFWPRSGLKMDIFFTTRCFMLLRGF